MHDTFALLLFLGGTMWPMESQLSDQGLKPGLGSENTES